MSGRGRGDTSDVTHGSPVLPAPGVWPARGHSSPGSWRHHGGSANLAAASWARVLELLLGKQAGGVPGTRVRAREERHDLKAGASSALHTARLLLGESPGLGGKGWGSSESSADLGRARASRRNSEEDTEQVCARAGKGARSPTAQVPGLRNPGPFGSLSVSLWGTYCMPGSLQ